MHPRTLFLALAVTVSVTTHGVAQQTPPANPQAETVTTGRVRINRPPKVFIGFSYTVTNGGPATVIAVGDDSPASRAGLVVGDSIMMIDGRDSTEPGAFFPGIAPGKQYTLRLRRGGEERDAVLVVAPPRPQPRP